MDPISLTLSAIGVGMQIFGGISGAGSASQGADISMDITRQEQKINDAKQKQMELEGRRTQMENIRNGQRARAMAENSAVSQGAQFGTGLQGGLAQVQDQTQFNMSGVNGALSIGREINTYNQAISQDKIQLAGVQSSAASAQGFASIGGAIMKAGPIVGQISQGFGSSSFGDYRGIPGSRNTGGLY